MEWKSILEDVQLGKRRSAMPENGTWKVDTEVKQAILECFKSGSNVKIDYGAEFIDKDTLPPRIFQPEDGVRVVPGGTSIRYGSYLADGVIVMPPAYVNIGAYVDSGTMIDSHVLVGSCAQIGKNVHLSAGVQIGGVLEPIGLAPVIIEDDAFIGAGSIIVEGIRICKRAVIAPGVQISASTTIYDLVNEKILEKGSDIPANAVVIPGTRPAKSEWGKELGIQTYCPVIVKYRDEKTTANLALEEALR